ncbi:MAG: efflux RND transporter permease subunit [Myxococcales bacterium]|nr:efflux RND transporter permease subunit [Myxococcales bacterium]
MIRRPATVLASVLLLLLLGALSVLSLPIQLTPDIAVPTLTVTTEWPGRPRPRSRWRSWRSRRTRSRASPGWSR